MFIWNQKENWTEGDFEKEISAVPNICINPGIINESRDKIVNSSSKTKEIGFFSVLGHKEMTKTMSWCWESKAEIMRRLQQPFDPF